MNGNAADFSDTAEKTVKSFSDSAPVMHIALTGGIGSGKSFVCRLLGKRGIRVYDCDEAAKRLMLSDRTLQQNLSRLIGEEVCHGGRLQKRALAEYILRSEKNKQAVNDIVHPAVALDYLRSGIEWFESAILFESGFDKRINPDLIVCVTAPAGVRIARVMERDSILEPKAKAWVDSQMPQEEMARRSDFTLVNDGHTDLDKQIDNLLNNIKNNR